LKISELNETSSTKKKILGKRPKANEARGDRDKEKGKRPRAEGKKKGAF